MIKEGKFGLSEAVWLTIITICAKVFYTSPAMAAKIVGTTAWYMTLISAATAMIGFVFIYLLLKRFPGNDLIAVYMESAGPYIGFVFSMLLAILLMFTAGTRIREFSEVLKVYILPESPPSYIIAIFTIVTAISCFLGLETIARFAKLLAYIMVLGFFCVIILCAKYYEFYRILPILGNGIGPTVFNGLIRSSAYGEVIVLAVFARSLQGINHVKKAGFISLGLSAFFISLSLVAFTLTFPYTVASEMTSPMYEMVSLIKHGRFLQRLDPIFLFIWAVSSFISVIVVLYSFISIYCKIFRIQDTRPMIMPSSIILFAVALIPSDFTSVMFSEVSWLRNYAWTIVFIPPLIALIAAKIRKKGVNNAR